MGCFVGLLFALGAETTEPFALFALLGQQGAGPGEGGGCCKPLAGFWVSSKVRVCVFRGVGAAVHPRPLPPLCSFSFRGQWEGAGCLWRGKGAVPGGFASWEGCASCRHQSMQIAQLLPPMQVAVKGDRGTNPAGSCGLSPVLIS